LIFLLLASRPPHQIAATKHEGAANKAMYALGNIVRSPVPLARSQFYDQAGLGQLQALLGQAAGAPLRVKSKAINLIADLIEMTANGDDESLATWDEKVRIFWCGMLFDAPLNSGCRGAC
jgi:hypothetical protein